MIKSCPNIIDSHAHLNFYLFKDDKDLIFHEASKKGAWVINVGSNFETSRKAVEMAQDYSVGIYSAIGVHPIHVMEEVFDEECMMDLARNNERVIAIGETGLDYYHLYDANSKLKNVDDDPQLIKDKQKKLLIKHLELARKLNLPLILHTRHYQEYDAHDDMIEILSQFKEKHNDYQLRGVMHCYTGNLMYAKLYLKLGFHLGFTGVITFSNDYDDVVKNLPLDRILVETDCPYLAPEPKRGKRNQPTYVEYVAKRVAEIKEIDQNQVNKATVENTRNLFNI